MAICAHRLFTVAKLRIKMNNLVVFIEIIFGLSIFTPNTKVNFLSTFLVTKTVDIAT